MRSSWPLPSPSLARTRRETSEPTDSGGRNFQGESKAARQVPVEEEVEGAEEEEQEQEDEEVPDDD